VTSTTDNKALQEAVICSNVCRINLDAVQENVDVVNRHVDAVDA
jgi:transcription elongation factor Elf1